MDKATDGRREVLEGIGSETQEQGTLPHTRIPYQ